MRASARFSVRPISDYDLDVYERVFTNRSLLLDAIDVVPWTQFQQKLEKYYSPGNEGQPEYPPLILLKLELLCHFHGIGRQKAIERATSDLHWKYFLGLPIDAILPDQSTLCVFRKRLGVDGFKEIFDDLVGVAHVPTWDLLHQMTRKTGFLYIADCKLASAENLGHIDREGGRFITILLNIAVNLGQ